MELLWIATAYGSGLLASALRLPPLVGYLAAGYLLHMVGAGNVSSLARLAELGILLLLFTVGLKLKPAALFRREVLGVGGLHMLVVAGLSGLVFFALGGRVTGGLLLGTSLAFSSTVLAVKVLEDGRELGSFHGRAALGILIFQDIVAVAILALAGGTSPTPWALGLLFLPLLRPLAIRMFDASQSDELRLLLGVTLAFAGGEMARAVGMAEDLGALLMGVLLAGHRDSADLAKKLWGLKEVFLVAFFLQIGLAGLPDRTQIVQALALIGLLPLQAMLFFVLLLLVGLRARTAFVASLALMTYSEFALIASSVIIDAGLLAPGWKPVLGVAVATSLALAAPLCRYANHLYAWLEPYLSRYERRIPHPDEAPTDIGTAQWLVIGMGRTGIAAYRALENQGERVLGLDADPTRVRAQYEAGQRVVYGDAEDHQLWEKLPLARIKGIILTLPDSAARRSATVQLRKIGYTGLIGATAFHPDEDASLYRSQADVVFHPLTEAGERLAERMLETDVPTARKIRKKQQKRMRERDGHSG